MNYDTVNAHHILSFSEIKKAAENLGGSIIHTPLCEAKYSKYIDFNLYLKCENLQYTGSCAERGVINALLSDLDGIKGQGLIVPSRGNMALAAAYHGTTLGVPVTAVLLDRTPPATAQRCSELGADVILCGDTLSEAKGYAEKAALESKQYVLSQDDPAVMAGFGTLGVEIVMQLPEVDAVIVPASSGALLAAVMVACKRLKCSCLVYGVESAKVPKLMKALQAGKPVEVPEQESLADGLTCSQVSDNAFATIKGRLDRMLVVQEKWIARAVINVLERERLVTDGAGACAVAAVMQGLVPELRNKKTVCVLTSGSIEAGRLARVIQRGLGASSRLMRFAVPVPDHRGGLEALARVIADESVVLKSLVTEQMSLHSDVAVTWANVVVEIANDDHATNFKDHLREIYPSARFTIADLDPLSHKPML